MDIFDDKRKSTIMVDTILIKLKRIFLLNNHWITCTMLQPESDFIEFESRLKSANNQFQLSAGLNIETLIPFLSGDPRLGFRSAFCSKYSIFWKV